MTDEAHPLRNWIRANVYASVLLTITIASATITIAYSVVHWIDNQAFQIGSNEAAIILQKAEIKTLNEEVTVLDRKVSDLQLRVTDLHGQSNLADAALKARLDTIDALSKFAAEHATMPPLPPPFVPPSIQGPRR